MERLTFEGNFCDISRCEDEYRMTSECAEGACSQRKVWERLKEYEDTGLTPEEIVAMRGEMVTAYDSDYKPYLLEATGSEAKHIVDLLNAELEGRLVVLYESRRPLIWGDADHNTILRPNCERDLMGGFELSNSDEATMFQCPHCGCPVDATKATEMVED